MSKNNKELNFRKKINCSEPLELSLEYREVRENLVEFIWFFNGTNNSKYLLENNHHGFIDILYKKYCIEIDSLIKHYELSDIIEESEFFHGWFSNWKQLEKFTQLEFLAKIKTDPEFSNIWGDFGMSDSIEFRNWGIEINFDSEDKGTISKKGKDQFKQIINSLATDPVGGFHVLNFYNLNNFDDRLIKNNLLYIKIFCEEINFEDRVKWFLQNYYETGMEYEILLENFRKNNDLDAVNWYEEIVYVPKYKVNLIADYNVIEDNIDLEKKILFNVFMIKYVSSLFKMIPNNIIINSTYKLNKKMSKKVKNNYKIDIKRKNFDSLTLELEDFKIN
jgi:hypothetical protein